VRPQERRNDNRRIRSPSGDNETRQRTAVPTRVCVCDPSPVRLHAIQSLVVPLDKVENRYSNSILGSDRPSHRIRPDFTNDQHDSSNRSAGPCWLRPLVCFNLSSRRSASRGLHSKRCRRHDEPAASSITVGLSYGTVSRTFAPAPNNRSDYFRQ